MLEINTFTIIYIAEFVHTIKSNLRPKFCREPGLYFLKGRTHLCENVYLVFSAPEIVVS